MGFFCFSSFIFFCSSTQAVLGWWGGSYVVMTLTTSQGIQSEAGKSSLMKGTVVLRAWSKPPLLFSLSILPPFGPKGTHSFRKYLKDQEVGFWPESKKGRLQGVRNTLKRTILYVSLFISGVANLFHKGEVNKDLIQSGHSNNVCILISEWIVAYLRS